MDGLTVFDSFCTQPGDELLPRLPRRRVAPITIGRFKLLAGLPTLVVVGEQDELTPPALARTLADGIPGATLSIIPGSGHLPPVEQPLATTRVLAEFLQSLP